MSNRRTFAAMVIAAAAFLVEGVAVIGHRIPDDHWGTRGSVVDIAGAVGFFASAVALSSFSSVCQGRRGGVGAVRVAQGGLVAMTIESVASAIRSGNTLGPLFVIGLLCALGGLLVTAGVGVREESTRWIAPLPFVGLIVSIAAGNQGGAIVFAVVWLALAAWLRRDAPRFAG